MHWNFGHSERTLRRVLSRFPVLKRVAGWVRRTAAPAWRSSNAAKHWDARVEAVESEQPLGWLDCEVVEREYIRPRVSGDSEVSYLEYFLATHLSEGPVEQLLSLGCGGGNLERDLLRLGAAEAIDGFDGSEASIGMAQELAERDGFTKQLTYRVADLNQLELPTDRYDVVVIKMALHHFEALEHVYSQLRRCLKPGGLLMFNEFVGPTRFQWTETQLAHMNQLLQGLPQRIRRQASVVVIRRPLVADMIAQDPSESVRSSEIMPLLEKDFEIVEKRGYGGTLLHILLSHVLPLLDLDDPEDLGILRSLMDQEGRLLDEGSIPSDFAYVVARPLRT